MRLGPDAPPLAVVGATGLVGEVLLAELAARGVPAACVRALASEASTGRRVAYGAATLAVRPVGLDELAGVRVAFLAATADLARELAPRLAAAGTFVVDKSSAFRRDPDVPLVVPAVVGHLLESAPPVVASPNCTTIGVVHALEPLRRAAGLVAVTVTTLQAASGVGRAGLETLEAERAGRVPSASPFPSRLHDDVVPTCGALDAQGSSEEEHKLRHELRRILGLDGLAVEATCLRVPVAVGHTASLRVRTARPIDLAAARAAFESFDAVRLVDAPRPGAVAGTGDVLVGRLRVAEDGDVLLVQTADNLRRGAATNALECAEGLLAASPGGPRRRA